jgi:hypothetical protein
MIEVGFIVLGAVLGVTSVLAVQWLYSWIASMRRQVDSVKWDLERYQRMREDWVEFSFWKNEHKKETKT